MWGDSLWNWMKGLKNSWDSSKNTVVEWVTGTDTYLDKKTSGSEAASTVSNWVTPVIWVVLGIVILIVLSKLVL